MEPTHRITLTSGLVQRRIALAVVTGVATIWAAASLRAANGNPVLTGTVSFSSRYIYRGIERTGAANQFALDGAFGGWRGRLWGNQPYQTSEPGELQSSLGYVWKVADSLDVELRGTHFWYVHHPIRGTASHSFEADLDICWHLPDGWDVGATPLMDLRYRSTGGELWVERAIPLERWGAFLHLRAYAGSISGRNVAVDEKHPPIHDSYTYWGILARLPYRIAGSTTLFAEANLAGVMGQDPAWSPLRHGSGARAWINCGLQIDL